VVSKRPPSIHFPEGTDYDFGVVEEDAYISHSFLFENRGGMPLLIKKIVRSCNCIAADAETLQLKPGDSSKIDVKYKARPINHRETLKVWVETTDSKRPIVPLTVTGRIHLKVFWYPQSTSFYCPHGTDSQQKLIQFLIDDSAELDIREISTSSKRISASWNKTDKGIETQIILDPNCQRGNWTDKVTMKVSVGDYTRDIEIPVYIMIK
jgi:hypothetical protein